MATNEISRSTAFKDLYTKPKSAILAVATASMLAERVTYYLGIDCSKYVNFGKISGTFTGLFGFWDCGGVIQSTYDLGHDFKTVGYDIHYLGTSREVVREGKSDQNIKPVNEDMLKDMDADGWLAFRTVIAVCKIFSGYVLAYGVLSGMGAIQSAPSPKLNIWGKALGIVGLSGGIHEIMWKTNDNNGPIYSKIKDGKTTPDEYKKLYDKKNEHDKYLKVNFIIMKLIGIVSVWGAISAPRSFVGRISKYKGEAFTLSFMSLNYLFFQQQLEAGSKINQIETEPKKKK